MLAAAVIVSGALASSQHTIAAPRIAEGWDLHDDSLCSLPLWAAIVLKESRLDELEALAHRVSDPRDTQYGNHLTTQRIAHFTAPADSARSTLLTFLASGGIKHSVIGGADTWSTLLIEEESGASLGRLFNTTCTSLRNQQTGQAAALLGSLKLPRAVAEVVVTVYGVHELPVPPPRRKGLDPGRARQITPAVIRQTYHVNHTVGSGSTKARSAVMQFSPSQTMKPSDLQQFFKQFSPEPFVSGWDQVYHFSGDNPGGGSEGHNAGNEASLDIDYIMGVAPGVKAEFWAYTEKGSARACSSGRRRCWRSRILRSSSQSHTASREHSTALAAPLRCRSSSRPTI